MKTPNKNYLKIINLKSVGSTNDYAIKLAEEGAQEITVITAEEQTHGRGRLKRTWFSPKNKGIYASFIFRPDNPLNDLYYLPLTMSLAAAKVIYPIVNVKIKMPNDILVNSDKEKKIAGVLVEAKSFLNKIDFVVVGIGININSKIQELPQTATSLYIETNKVYNIKNLTKQLIKEVIDLYFEFRKQNFKYIFTELYKFQQKPFKKLILDESFYQKYKEVIKFL